MKPRAWCLRRLPWWAAVLVLALFLPDDQSASAATLADRVFEATLANGLKVLLVEEPKAPVVSIQIWYKVGSRNEPVGKSGISHMIEHMMFKGTPTVGPKQFDRMVQRNGGHDNAYTTADYTAYYEDFAADRVLLGLTLEADRMAHLLLDEKEFLPERQVVMEERRLRIEDQPANVLGEVMRATAFLAHPYRWPVIGWSSDIESYTREDLVRYFHAHYAPNNAILIVAGDVKQDALFPKIQELFGKIPRGPETPKVVTVEPKQVGERRVYVKKEAELPVFSAVYHVPNLAHPDSFALDVLAYVLGGGQSSRLHQSVVYHKQLASYASADYSGIHVDPYLFGLSAGPLPGKAVEEVEQAMYAEVERIQHEPVSERELQKAKNQIASEFIFAQDSVHRLASLLGEFEAVASWRLLAGYVDGIQKVTAPDVTRVAREYLTKENRTAAILIPVNGAAAASGTVQRGKGQP
ncbi:MAG TPA: pitrilysin family protein [Candidatus Methylomirabilis sp.]|nr:pitrilysin family protein [Candidatus Methylomirabilis sp.]